MQQKRFVLALLISAAILLGWSYFYHPPQNNANNSNIAQQPQSSPAAQPAATATPAPQPSQTVNTTPSTDTLPQRTVEITTPLYKITLDSHGAVATSWIIRKNRDTGNPSDVGRDLSSVSGDKDHPQPLQLISQDGMNREPREAPLRLETIDGDANVNTALGSKNYQINGLESDEQNVSIVLAPGQKKTLDFVLHDDATGLDVTKSITFNADVYSTDLAVNVKRNGNPFSQSVRILIGPSIGDQGISKHTFYSVAPLGVAVIGKETQRFYAEKINGNKESP